MPRNEYITRDIRFELTQYHGCNGAVQSSGITVYAGDEDIANCCSTMSDAIDAVDSYLSSVSCEGSLTMALYFERGVYAEAYCFASL